jgi:Tol biopolymer transport system component
MVDSNGDNLKQITDFAGNEVSADWSKDGVRILFEYSIESLEEEIALGKREMSPSGIWVYDISNEMFLFLPGTENGGNPQWRP